jgi:hypothetical protein
MKNITWYFQGSMRKTRTLSGNYLKHHSIERLIRMLVPENSNLPYGQLQVLTYALDKQNDLTENYLQIPWYVDKSRCDEVESTIDS